MQHHPSIRIAINWHLIVVAIIVAAALFAVTSAPASAMDASAMRHARPHTAMHKTSAMQAMPCMSEMQTMMRSMHPTGHQMSMSAMRSMMAGMHLPAHPTHAQCQRAMQTMMARMHPGQQMGNMQMSSKSPMSHKQSVQGMQPIDFVPMAPCEG